MLVYEIIAFVLTFIEFPPKSDSYGRAKEGAPKRKIDLPFYKLAIIIGILGLFITSIIIKVEGQDAGVKVTPSGVSDEELHTGWHIVMPWNTVHMMDKTVCEVNILFTFFC